MLVHNIRGTSDRKPKNGYDTWIEFWKKKQGYSPYRCGCKTCWESLNLVGAHVQKSGNNTEDYWYILPLCKKHNNPNNKESFEISDPDDLVRITDND